MRLCLRKASAEQGAAGTDEGVADGYIKKDQLRVADPTNNQLMVFLNYMAPVVRVFLLACAYPF